MTDAQRKIHEAIRTGPRGRFGGPFIPLLRSPEMLDRVQALGETLRFHGRLDGNLREVAILAVSKHWRCAVEWDAHVRIALKEGVSQETIQAIVKAETSAPGGKEVCVVLALCAELLETQFVSDAVYRQALDLLGESGTVELVTLIGYYALLAMLLNAFEILPGAGEEELPAQLRLPA